jgi:FKBP-type peptidyl-prolyl cis-trans isomerase
MRRFAGFVVALVAVTLCVTTAVAQSAQGPLPPQPTAQENADFLAANAKKKGVIVRPSGLQFRIIRNGFGVRPTLTDTVTVNYTGKLINGVLFDGTSPGLPASFKVNQLVQGWIEALLSMRVGDRWQLVIPARLGYGVRGAGDVGPDQTLVFDMELLATKPAPKKGEKGYIPEPGEEKN